MPSKAAPWYRGMAQHALVWVLATIVFLFDDRVDTSIRVNLSFALGVTCLALFFAGWANSARDDRRRRRARLAYLVGATLLLGLLSLHGAYVRTFGGLNAESIKAIGQTDVAEAFGYVVTRLGLPWVAMWLGSALFLWLTYPAGHSRPTPRRSVLTMLLVAGIGLIALGRGVITEPLATVKSYYGGMAALREATLWRKAHPLPPIASDFNGTVIVVIGESTSRHHMSIYGYPRQTTPNLAALGHELAIFDDVISTHSSTPDALRDALTIPAPADRPGERITGILQLAKAGGFETSWLSNQNEFGVWDSPVRILAEQADQVRYHDPSLGKLSSRREFDEAMLPSLDQVLAGPAPRKLIIVHLMSTHLPYCWTKPADFNPLREDFGKRLFGRKGDLLFRLKLFVRRRGFDLDCYDNGVRYVDRVLGGIIARANRLAGPAAVLYFSDHGDAPLLATGHDSAEHSAYHLEIPFLLWGNDAYRVDHRETWAAAKANQTKPFSIGRLAPTLADLLALQTPAVRKEDSLFSPAFTARPRSAIDGQIRYDQRWKGNDYRENSLVFARQLGTAGPRVWSHRTNSLGALLEAKRTFSGVEMDVHFDPTSRTFQVRHDYPHIGLGLREMLEWSRDRPEMRIWLDWKNATPENVRAALAELIALDRQYGLKGRMLVETDSSATFPELAVISRAGFVHGYYLPTDEMLAAIKQGPAAMNRLAAEVKRVILRGRFDAVTYDAETHPFVQATLDRFLTEHDIRRYSWDTRIDSGDADSDPAAVARMVRERRLGALLIRFPSDFWI